VVPKPAGQRLQRKNVAGDEHSYYPVHGIGMGLRLLGKFLSCMGHAGEQVGGLQPGRQAKEVRLAKPDGILRHYESRWHDRVGQALKPSAAVEEGADNKAHRMLPTYHPDADVSSSTASNQRARGPPC
jgi:hypothetical protein